MFTDFDYTLPSELIAQEPIKPRDAARLLVYRRTGTRGQEGRFFDLPKYLPKGAVLVFNKTKVIPARLEVWKESGGRVRLLYLGTQGKMFRALADRKLEEGSVLTLTPQLRFKVVRGGAKKHSHILKNVRMSMKVWYVIKPLFPIARLLQVLEKYGTTPIPPYIKHSPLSEKKLREEYQTVFAEVRGSVAAPTASLHFTKSLLKKLRAAGFGIEYVTLHVNLGTFAPVTDEQMKQGRLHEECYEVDAKTARALRAAKRAGRPVIAVGTTVVRTLESASNARGILEAGRRTTDLFIRPGYRFKIVDGIITNFHVPKSSLLMLVAAFTGRKKLFELYRQAIRRQYRFFSFGDGMLLY